MKAYWDGQLARIAQITSLPDVIGILANLFTQGYTDNAHGLLLRARHVSGNQPQYLDGVWTYPWVRAIYLIDANGFWTIDNYEALNATTSASHLTYLPCSMTEPNTANRCANAEDAN